MGNVFKLYPDSLAPDFRFEPDDILDDAKGKAFQTLLIVGEFADGTYWISSNANMGESVMLALRAQQWMVFGDPDE